MNAFRTTALRERLPWILMGVFITWFPLAIAFALGVGVGAMVFGHVR
jgi:hypothetical protein